MTRTKFYWETGHQQCEGTQRVVAMLAAQMGLKHLVFEPDEDIRDLVVSVPDEKLTPFLDALKLARPEVASSCVCDNDVQKLAIDHYVGEDLGVVIDPTPLDEWEMGELDLLLHRRRQSFLRILDERGFEESEVFVPEGKGCSGGVTRHLAILDGEYSAAGGFREVRGYEYFTHACQRYYEIVDEHGDDGEWHLYDCDRDEGNEEIEYTVRRIICLKGLAMVPRMSEE